MNTIDVDEMVAVVEAYIRERSPEMVAAWEERTGEAFYVRTPELGDFREHELLAMAYGTAMRWNQQKQQ